MTTNLIYWAIKSSLFFSRRNYTRTPSQCQIFHFEAAYDPNTNPQIIINRIKVNIFPSRTLRFAAVPAAIFSATDGVATLDPVAVAVQLCPHTYPLGQQPPPFSAAQVNHPCAQLPVPNSVPAGPIPGPVGATITTPSTVATVVDADVGQEVRLQSRPTRQQPP